MPSVVAKEKVNLSSTSRCTLAAVTDVCVRISTSEIETWRTSLAHQAMSVVQARAEVARADSGF
jgi:hypothetical protein